MNDSALPPIPDDTTPTASENAAAMAQQLPPLPPNKVTFISSIRNNITKLFTLQGRTSRAEFWWFILFTFIIYFVLSTVLDQLLSIIMDAFYPEQMEAIRQFEQLGDSKDITAIQNLLQHLTGNFAHIYALLLALNCLLLALLDAFFVFAILVRRLHDTGRTACSAVIATATHVVQTVITAILIYRGIPFIFEFLSQIIHIGDLDEIEELIVNLLSENIASIIVVSSILILAGLVGLVASLYALCCSLLKSRQGANAYGPQP